MANASRFKDLQSASAPQKIAMTSSGAAPLIIAEVAITGENKSEFFQTNNCPVTPATLVAGASCVTDVTFRPSTPGVLTASRLMKRESSS